MRKVMIGSAELTGLCMGGNPFSGFSHQTPERTKEMLDFYTSDQIKATFRKAEEAGVNTVFARTDDQIYGIMKEYWEEGGTLQWFAQITTPKDNPDDWRMWLDKVAELGATGTYMHGGAVDFWHAQEHYDWLEEALERMRSLGVKAAGMAGHTTAAHTWIRDNLDVDFQMCCYYNPTDRTQSPHHQDKGEKWNDEDLNAMLELIPTIQKPVVHYKVFAGGNKPIIEGFERMGRTMKPADVACIGIYLGDDPEMIAKDVKLFEEYVDKKA